MSEAQTAAAQLEDTQPAADYSSQQVTSKIPTTKPAKTQSEWLRAKPLLRNQDRLAKRRKKPWLRLARVIIANNQAKETSTAGPEKTVGEDVNATRNVFTTTQWFSVVSILVSMLGNYYKREEIKRVFTKRPPQTPPPSPTQPLVDAAPQPKKGISSV